MLFRSPLQRLQRQLAPEPAALQERLGGLEALLAELEATNFSPTTSLRGDVRWWLGGVGYSGNQINRAANTYGGQPLRDAVIAAAARLGWHAKDRDFAAKLAARSGLDAERVNAAMNTAHIRERNHFLRITQDLRKITDALHA